MSSKSTASARQNHKGRTVVRQGIEQARRAVSRTAAGLKQAGSKIRSSERTKRIAKSGRKAGAAVKQEVEKHAWLRKAVDSVTGTAARVTKATREHLVDKRYFDRSLKAIGEQVKRYPAIENAWNHARHAFSMDPESSATGTAAGTATGRKKAGTKKKSAKKKKTARKTTARKKTATKKKTAKKTARKSTARKKSAKKKSAKKKARRAA